MRKMSIQTMAVKVVQGFRRTEIAGRELYAETIEIRHDPPVPSFDGLWLAKDILDHNERELVAWRRAMSDFRYEDIECRLLDWGFEIALALSGTLAGGKRIRVPARMRYAVESGQITAIEAWVDETKTGDLMEALQAGGWSPPIEALPQDGESRVEQASQHSVA